MTPEEQPEPTEERAPTGEPEPLVFVVPNIAWQKCPSCGAETGARAGDLCWDCREARAKAQAASERAQATARSIPAGYSYARFGDPNLRVALKRHAFRDSAGAEVPVQALAARLVHAHRIVFRGAASMGKTSLAVAMLRLWQAKHDATGLFVRAVRLSGGKFGLDDELVSAPLVLLDDMGQEKQVASNLLPDLIYERHAEDRALWVTTWMRREDAIARYGDGIARRVFERATIIDFDSGEIT